MAFTVSKPSRARSSTGASSRTLAKDEAGSALTAQLDSFALPEDSPGDRDATRLANVANSLSRSLADDKPAQDVFRRGNGFEKLLQMLSAVVGRFHDVSTSILVDTIRASLSLLRNALQDHRGNRRYFGKKLVGWAVIKATVENVQQRLLSTREHDRQQCSRLLESLFASMLSLALDLRQSFNVIDDVHDKVDKAEVQYSQLAVTALNLALKQLQALHDEVDNALRSCAEQVLEVLSEVANSSVRNRWALWQGGALSELLESFLRPENELGSSTAFGNLIAALGDFGLKSLGDVELLFRRATESDQARQLLLSILQRSKEPAFVQFDLAHCGHSSLELPCLPRPFPPSTGYTLSTWIRVDDYDKSSHTTIFGAFDASQHCFILAYLEQESHQIILQTSIRSSRPSVRFKSTRFARDRWYHVALVHRKSPADPIQSPAMLFVDGEFAEQVKIAYPEAPGEVAPKPHGGAPPTSSQRRYQPVQAFFGTPLDLAVVSGRNQVKSRWSLSSALLCATPLSDEFIAVVHRLGPRYCGNLQDCLGPLLTYRASAELNRYNELLHPEKSEKSDIVMATEHKGSEVMAETKIILSFNPYAVIDIESPRNSTIAARLELEGKAYSNYRQLSQKTTAVAINAAVPSVAEAISKTSGSALLIGEPVVIVPNALDDDSWRLSGSLPLLIRLLETSTSKVSFLQCVQIFFDCTKDNWRISEAMEKGSGFGLLAIIIREKLGLEHGWSSQLLTRKPSHMLPTEDRQTLPLDLLQLILEFVGYNRESPEDSMIVNPMAYRVLLIDFDTWRRCGLPTQSLYFTQFVHFINRNKHSAFNAKRLARMRIVKKLIDAMKTESMEPEAVEPLMKAFRAVLGDSATYHLYRDLAMFAAYGLQEDRMAAVNSIKSMASAVSVRSRAISWARSVRSSTPSTPGGPQVNKPPGVPMSTLAVETLDLLADSICTERSAAPIRRFNRAVPPRWLLHLLSEGDVNVVVLTLRLLCQALRCLGSEFRKPFIDTNNGFIILKARMKSFWRHHSVWLAAFALFFGQGLPASAYQEDVTLHKLIDTFAPSDETALANPEVIPIIMTMLEAGLRNVINQDQPNEVETKLLKTIIQFLNELFNRSGSFRDFAVASRYVQDLLFVLYPAIVGSDRLSAELELKADKDTLNFKGAEVRLRPHANSVGERPPSIRSLPSDNEATRPRSPRKVQAPKKLSSFEYLENGEEEERSAPAQFNTPITPKKAAPIQLNVGNALVESLVEVVINIFLDQICNNSRYSGIGLFLKSPPGFQEHQAYFESYMLVQTLSALWNHLQLYQSLLVDTKVLMNLAKFNQHIAEAVFEGWFVDGAKPVLNFAGKLLDHMQQPDIASLKSVRLCSQAINDVRVVFLRVTLLKLSELDETINEDQVVKFLEQMNYWQTILFSSENQEAQFIRLICYLLYTKLGSDSKAVRLAAAQLWRTVLVQKSSETATLLTFAMGPEQKHLSTGFMKLVSSDDDEFIAWFDENRQSLDKIFVSALAKSWDAHVEGENRRNDESARLRLSKRREKLRQWQNEESVVEDCLHRYESSTKHWRSNAHSQERDKLQRALQDQQENVSHLLTVFAKINDSMQQPCGLEPPTTPTKWQLDETEAVNRMRMRTVPDTSVHKEAVYEPKRKMSERRAMNSLSVNTSIPRIISDDMSAMESPTPSIANELDDISVNGRARSDSASNSQLLEGGFEMIDDPREDEEGIVEDKNRKVLTSLQRGDQVQQLYNISRIVGLEACEGLLVVGKKCLYLQDNFFQRCDGEIVSVAQAPEDERDPYVQLISGKDVGSERTKHSQGQQETRHWTWTEVLSISKRRFLFRDVSIEVFFTDGRSYLMTLMTKIVRDDVYNAIVARAPHVHSASSVASEDAWRLDTLRNPEEVPQTLGYKFATVFNALPTHTATKKWVRGDMSNFQYLMLINTMAGRTFNDLTQYPVFPWILADYTSEELDLTDPRSYRDLSKPMGCQNPARESEYRERFKQFAEMGDANAPPFHYGTHYSSAMIVSSYLIRLQPFVQSYLLLQGGSFDHADRLFDSIGKAWSSCSKDNMTDVRELTPEFFYLPEFLVNANQYDFGEKQANGGTVNDVQLPPWAKGDPQIFIAKQREALESPFVSENLHKWIDLVFGFKQRGEAAIEATNVFQHLSYQGAKDLDTIHDPVERLATIGIIHSFGQTPHQVFQRPHPARELEKFATGRLDTAAQSLTRLPSPVFESDEKIADLTFSRPQERLLCSGPCKLNLPPHCERYLQWGFADHSLRFFSSNSKRAMGLYENTHIGAVTTAVFADSKTLATGGNDCTIAIWAVSGSKESIEIHPKTCLFGHRAPVTRLAASRVFSTLLSISTDGQAILWDLNRHGCIRILLPAGSPSVQAARINNTNGHILLCQGPDVLVYTLNGHLLVRQRACEDALDSMTCAAFYEGAGGEWLERELIFTGHAHGIANVWALTTLSSATAADNNSNGAWHLQLLKRMNHADAAREDGANIAAAVTAILPLAQVVYTGDEDGRVWEWNCVRRARSVDSRKR